MGFSHIRMGTLRLYISSTLIGPQVSDNGLTGSIMTFYELTDGDMAHTTGKLPRPTSNDD